MPAATTAAEIAAAINAVYAGTASVVGGGAVKIETTTVGSASKIKFGVPASGDATAIIFGFEKGIVRSYVGSDVDNNIVIGTTELAFPGRLDIVLV